MRLQRGAGVRGWGPEGLGTGRRGGGARARRAFMVTCMKRLAVSSRGVSLPVSRLRVCMSNRQGARVSRGSVSLVFAFVKGEGHSPAQVRARLTSGTVSRPRAAPLMNSRRSTTWITSSARSSSDGGIVRPRALAVLRLMTSSTLVGCSMRRSAGLAPLNPRGEDTTLPKGVRKTGAVTHQSTCRSKLATLIDRGNRMARRQCDDLIAAAYRTIPHSNL
jgi:hypothetical protein